MDLEKFLSSLIGALVASTIAVSNAHAHTGGGLIPLDDLPVIGCVRAVATCFEDLSVVMRNPRGPHGDPCATVDTCRIFAVDTLAAHANTHN